MSCSTVVVFLFPSWNMPGESQAAKTSLFSSTWKHLRRQHRQITVPSANNVTTPADINQILSQSTSDRHIFRIPERPRHSLGSAMLCN